MFGAILKPTNSSFQKGMTFCRSIYVKKIIKLLAFIFEHPSYMSFSGVFVTCPYGALGWLWYLIVPIPDLCLLPYFNSFCY